MDETSTVDEEVEVSAPPPESEKKVDDDTIESIVEAAIKERLKPIKEKLDKAYEARDQALTQLEEFQKQERKREHERLVQEGKEKEALQMQLEDVTKERQKLESQVVSLTRDIEVKEALSKFELQSGRAVELAFKDIISDLVFKDNTWQHSSGKTVQQAVEDYFSDESNKFLLKQPESSGPGIGSIRSKPASSQPQSLFQLSQKDVLKMAQEGKLRR